ncbi:hypothetical protein D3C81_1794090 [compost metagenome]
MALPRDGKVTWPSRSSMRNSNSSDSIPGLSMVRSWSSRSLIKAVMSAPLATMRNLGVMEVFQKKTRTRRV